MEFAANACSISSTWKLLKKSHLLSGFPADRFSALGLGTTVKSGDSHISSHICETHCAGKLPTKIGTESSKGKTTLDKCKKSSLY